MLVFSPPVLCPSVWRMILLMWIPEIQIHTDVFFSAVGCLHPDVDKHWRCLGWGWGRSKQTKKQAHQRNYIVSSKRLFFFLSREVAQRSEVFL